MVNQFIIYRLNIRLQELKECKSPYDVSYFIWSKHFEECTGNKDEDRSGFIDWVESHKNNTKPDHWTPYNNVEDITELSEFIWPTYLDLTETDTLYFGSLRKGLIEWINQYNTQTQ